MDKNRRELARPGNREAEKVVAEPKDEYWAMLLGIMIFSWVTMRDHDFDALSIVLFVLMFCLLGYSLARMIAMPIRRNAARKRLIAEGHIVEPGPEFFQAWDEVCAEAGLNQQERAEAEKGLFYAAVDVAEFRSAYPNIGDPEHVLAYTRLRLRQLIEKIELHKQALRELSSQAQPDIPGGITKAEIDAEMRRNKRSRQA